MKFCKDCQHLCDVIFCVSPKNGINPVTGKPKPMFASMLRSDKIPDFLSIPDSCGPEAKNFEQKIAVKKKFFNLL